MHNITDNPQVEYNIEVENMKDDVKKMYKTRWEQNIAINETLTDDEKRKHKRILRMRAKQKKNFNVVYKKDELA